MTTESIPPSLPLRAAIHAALGDAHRLAVVDLLALSDRAPSELAAAVGLPSNLLAHHLTILEQAGVVVRHPSDGDGRRRYVRLVPESLSALWAAPFRQARAILFVCRHNSARSLFAQALWAAASPIPADSAGLVPAGAPHPLAVATAARHGLDLSAARPKGYAAVAVEPDVVISVCDRTRESELPPAAHRLHWSVPDPATSGDATAFEAAFAEVARRVALAARSIQPIPDQRPNEKGAT
jgi:protein-tyrosine-phosphatase/DNA-binding HxlR family transcriptional regulator